MNLRQWMRIDLGALFCGRGLVIDEPPPTVPRGRVSWWRRMFFGGYLRKDSARDRIIITDQLRQLVSCQAPLAEGLKLAAEDCPNYRVARHLYRLSLALEQGGSLSHVLRQFPSVCPRYYADLVEAADNSGRLSETLNELSRDLETDIRTRGMLRSRAIYLLLVLGLILLFGGFLLVKVFPVFEEIIADFGGAEKGGDGLIQKLMGGLQFLRDPLSLLFQKGADFYDFTLGAALRGMPFEMGALIVVVVLSLSLLTVAVVLFLLLRRPARFVFEQIPVIRTVVLYAHWGHALKIISLLLDRGIPLDRALEGAADTDLNRSTRRALLRMGAGTRSGLSLPELLRREGRSVPRSLWRAVAFGAHAGQLPETLARLAHIYRLRSERTLRVFMDIAFPLAIIGCGALVASINTRIFLFLSNIADGIMGGI